MRCWIKDSRNLIFPECALAKGQLAPGGRVHEDHVCRMKGFWIESPADPGHHLFMLFVTGVSHGFQQFLVPAKRLRNPQADRPFC